MQNVRLLRYAAWTAIGTWLLMVTLSPSFGSAGIRAMLLLPALVAGVWPLISSVKIRIADVRTARLSCVLLAGLLFVSPVLYVWFVPTLGLLFSLAFARNGSSIQHRIRF